MTTRLLLIIALGCSALFADENARQAQLAKLAQAKIDVAFDKTPLDEAARQLATLLGVPVAVDDGVYRRYEGEQLRLTLQGSGLAGEQALELVCQLLGLEYGVTASGVLIKDRSGKPAHVVTRTFYVGDIALALRDFPGPRLGMGQAYPLRFIDDLPLDDDPYLHGRYGYRAPHLGFDGADEDAVPLGLPTYEDEPTFTRPPYQGRHRHAPFMQENIGEILALVERIQGATGGAANWQRDGVDIRLARGSVLVVTHAPGIVAAVERVIAAARQGDGGGEPTRSLVK